MASNTAAVPDTPARRRLPVWARIVVWLVRLGLLALIYFAVKLHWFSMATLRARIFPAVVLFIGFSIYWGIAARNRAPTKSSESRGSTIFHQVWTNCAYVVLFWPIPGLRGWFEPPQIYGLVLAGLAIEAASIGLAIWARRHLGRNWSAAVRIGEGHELVRTGPYRFLRHPIYTGVLGMVLGIALVSGQYHALIALGMLIIAYIRKTRLEDNILRDTFGSTYDDYRRHTWGLVPLIY
ncbi:MAG TPA: isoprenylcysteine carboxylmethyltransferase family protein [Candidatus Acidoferrales bacterium]|nr:isoprenylcysteine carboxylmethyltransferase family protein [Candidatus Acidoferrales bacterium]